MATPDSTHNRKRGYSGSLPGPRTAPLGKCATQKAKGRPQAPPSSIQGKTWYVLSQGSVLGVFIVKATSPFELAVLLSPESRRSGTAALGQLPSRPSLRSSRRLAGPASAISIKYFSSMCEIAHTVVQGSSNSMPANRGRSCSIDLRSFESRREKFLGRPNRRDR